MGVKNSEEIQDMQSAIDKNQTMLFSSQELAREILSEVRDLNRNVKLLFSTDTDTIRWINSESQQFFKKKNWGLNWFFFRNCKFHSILGFKKNTRLKTASDGPVKAIIAEFSFSIWCCFTFDLDYYSMIFAKDTTKSNLLKNNSNFFW